jgi:hypothetical protein
VLKEYYPLLQIMIMITIIIIAAVVIVISTVVVITVVSIWDLWLTKWYWDRSFHEYFGFPVSISLHRCSITWKNEKN